MHTEKAYEQRDLHRKAHRLVYLLPFGCLTDGGIRSRLADADALAADIGGVYSVSRYNAETQDLTWRLPGVSGDNFPVRAGYPYIVCVDETAPTAWP